VTRADLAAGLASLLLTGCLNINWSRDGRLEPLPDDALAALAPGDALDACLAALGAPLYLWEYEGDGMALAFGGGEIRYLGMSLSFSVADNIDASFNFDAIDEQFEGVVLVFDSELRLRWIRRGLLGQLVQDGRRRSAAPADDGVQRGSDAQLGAG
jgi:hypothetical protein